MVDSQRSLGCGGLARAPGGLLSPVAVGSVMERAAGWDAGGAPVGCPVPGEAGAALTPAAGLGTLRPAWLVHRALGTGLRPPMDAPPLLEAGEGWGGALQSEKPEPGQRSCGRRARTHSPGPRVPRKSVPSLWDHPERCWGVSHHPQGPWDGAARERGAWGEGRGLELPCAVGCRGQVGPERPLAELPSETPRAAGR